MRWWPILLLTSCASKVTPPALTTFSCVDQSVCVLNEADKLIAVNTSSAPIAIELRISHIRNVELSYRYPFVELLAPQSSRVLLTFRRKKPQRPYALDYDWNWRNTQDLL